jgi:hypothetical protein
MDYASILPLRTLMKTSHDGTFKCHKCPRYACSHTTFFNQPIGNWDVSSVTDMRSMFAEAFSFDRSIGNWNVSSVTDMSFMFFRARLFDQSIGNWDVSSVTVMSFMFFSCSVF